MRLGTAVWSEGAAERRALVALLESDPSRVVDLNRVERMRLTRMGEGRADVMADALVPPSLRQILEGGLRSLHRARQALAYAEKWARRGDLPLVLAPRLSDVTPLPCLPRPSRLRHVDGTLLDRLLLQGPGGCLRVLPQPTLAVLGMHGGRVAGCCLALENGGGAILGGWMSLEIPDDGFMEMCVEGHHRRVPMDAWSPVSALSPLAAEVVLLPPPRWRALAGLVPGCDLKIACPFETLPLALGNDLPHPTLQ